MCGRFLLTTPGQALVELLGLSAAPQLSPRYNIAPTQDVAIVRAHASGLGREWRTARWGLVPHWAKRPPLGAPLFNARSESAADKPAFRDAFRARRCLVPADGFYEWKRRGRARQPYVFRMRDEGAFAFAGLYDHWRGGGGPPIDSCTILTTAPNELLVEIHDRMPVILHAADYARWLTPADDDRDALLGLLRPYPASEMVGQPVGAAVNSATHDAPDCIEPDRPRTLF